MIKPEGEKGIKEPFRCSIYFSSFHFDFQQRPCKTRDTVHNFFFHQTQRCLTTKTDLSILLLLFFLLLTSNNTIINFITFASEGDEKKQLIAVINKIESGDPTLQENPDREAYTYILTARNKKKNRETRRRKKEENKRVRSFVLVTSFHSLPPSRACGCVCIVLGDKRVECKKLAFNEAECMLLFQASPTFSLHLPLSFYFFLSLFLCLSRIHSQIDQSAFINYIDLPHVYIILHYI